MDHKPVIDACDLLCAVDMRLGNIIVFANAGCALLLEGGCNATDWTTSIRCSGARCNSDVCSGCVFQRDRGYIGACSDRKATPGYIRATRI